MAGKNSRTSPAGCSYFMGYGIICIFLLCFTSVFAYYSHVRCFGTGDCILTTGYLSGGYSDEYNKWLIECSDGEAMTGVYDNFKQFMGIAQVWCYFMFPLKPPSRGIYPYYPSCLVRNFTMQEFYCYDKYYPTDSVDTFSVGLFGTTSADPAVPTMMKCCKTPKPYKLDYSRCQWKYTHDKAGEHYDGYWVTKCDTNFVMTGMGEAVNPWDNILHYVWIQCCPVIVVPELPYNQRFVGIGGYNGGGGGGGYSSQNKSSYRSYDSY